MSKTNSTTPTTVAPTNKTSKEQLHPHPHARRQVKRRLPGNLLDIFDPARPYGLQCTTQFGGTRKYKYTFSIVSQALSPLPSTSKAGNRVECSVTIQRWSIDNRVTRSTGEEDEKTAQVTNAFYLYPHDPGFTYALVCDRLGEAWQQPPLCMILQYSPASRQWRIESSYNNIRALFTLNSPQESFGVLAAVSCTSCVVMWDTRPPPPLPGKATRDDMSEYTSSTMAIEAKSGSWVLNRFIPCDLHYCYPFDNDDDGDEEHKQADEGERDHDQTQTTDSAPITGISALFAPTSSSSSSTLSS